MTRSPGRLRTVTLAQSSTLIFLLALLFLFDRGAHLLYGGISFALLAVYHLLTDRRYTPEQIRASGLMTLHVVVYLLLCTLVIWATTGEEESTYWLIYLLPIAVAAANLTLRGTLLTCAAAALLFASLTPRRILAHPWQNEEDLAEIMVFCLMFFIVGVLVQAFSEQNRRQLAQQRELNERLLENQQVLKESLARLEAAEENLRRQERLAALGEMSAGIAHEIRNPLGIISSSAQLLGGKVAGAVPGAGQLLDIIQEETARLNGLITDFLAFGRPARPSCQVVDLRGVVLKAVEPVREMALHKGVRIAAEFSAASLRASVDPDMIQQLLLNLLLNALEATPPGGEIVVRLAPRGKQVLVAVHDTGCGIPEENRTKIFNPFFTTKEKGTGLGLANAHRIVEAHGGTLTVESTPGAGTTFFVALPGREG